MTRLPLWALVPILIILAACSGQTPIPAATSTSVAATAEPSSITPPAQSTPGSTTAAVTPTPASSTETSTPVSTQELTTATPTPATSLAITVAPIPADIPEYSRSQWKHWIDEDGDCQDARQEALISESLVEVTFESERKCRVETGRWYGAFASIYVEGPGDLDIDHLVPLKNAHDSGGWAWSSARKEQYANYSGDPDHRGHQGSQPVKGSEGAGGVAAPGRGLLVPATDWTEVKMEWGLTMTQTETEAVIDMLDTCEEPVEVEVERAKDIAGTETSGQTTEEEATATPTLVPEPEPDVNTSMYESCEVAVEAGDGLGAGARWGWRCL